jgi:hypothetical protein
VRQPEVGRLTRLLVALLLAAPVVRAAWSLLSAGAFLLEFLGGPPLLSGVTLPPAREPLPVAGLDADLYRASPPGGGASLVLVHGVTPAGKDDPQVRAAAVLLGRLGFDVAVPTVTGLAQGRLRPDDVTPVVASIAALRPPVAMIGVSVGAGPALLAAADARVRDRVRIVLSLGGYASAPHLVRFYLTGAHAWGASRGRVRHDPALVRHFVAANADLLGLSAEVAAALAPGRLAALVDRPPPPLADLLTALSPAAVAPHIRARLVLVHGRDDPAVPYTESLRLAAARAHDTTLILVDSLHHVEPTTAPTLTTLHDFTRLWLALYTLRNT